MYRIARFENKNFHEISVSFICRELKNPESGLKSRLTGDMDQLFLSLF